MRSASTLAAIISLILLSGCAATTVVTDPAPYVPVGHEGSRFGYSERRQEDGGWFIQFVGTLGNEWPQLEAYASRRAGELCGGNVKSLEFHRGEWMQVETHPPSLSSSSPVEVVAGRIPIVVPTGATPRRRGVQYPVISAFAACALPTKVPNTETPSK